MSPLPVIADTCRVALFYRAIAGTPERSAINVMHFATNGDDAATVGASVAANWTTAMMRPVDGDIVAYKLQAKLLDGALTPTAEINFGPLNGGASGDIIPAVAAIVKLTTASGGRSGRGRVFLPFVGEGAQSNGALTGTIPADTTAAWAAFLAALTAANHSMVVASYKLRTVHFVTAATCELETGTQRRRQSRNR